MSSTEDRTYIKNVLIPEILRDFDEWAKEYQQPRDLGIRGEFVGLYRKTRKLKTIFWDTAHGMYPNADRGWREGPRTIIKEVAAHALLMLLDWDRTFNTASSIFEDLPVEGLSFTECGDECQKPMKHTLRGDCNWADEASMGTMH